MLLPSSIQPISLLISSGLDCSLVGLKDDLLPQPQSIRAGPVLPPNGALVLADQQGLVGSTFQSLRSMMCLQERQLLFGLHTKILCSECTSTLSSQARNAYSAAATTRTRLPVDCWAMQVPGMARVDIQEVFALTL